MIFREAQSIVSQRFMEREERQRDWAMQCGRYAEAEEHANSAQYWRGRMLRARDWEINCAWRSREGRRA